MNHMEQNTTELIGECQSEDLQETGILPSVIEGDISIAKLICSHCSRSRELTATNPVFKYLPVEVKGQTYEYSGTASHNARTRQRYDVFHVTVECAECRQWSVYTLTQDGVIFNPGKLFEEGIREEISDSAKTMLQEATRCFFGNSFRGTLAMCRAALEQALTDKNVTGAANKNLAGKIQQALDKGILVAIVHTALYQAFGLESGLLGWGILFGFIHWIIVGMGLGMMGTMHPMMRKGDMDAPGAFAMRFPMMNVMGFLMLHLVYGLVLGALYEAWA